MDKKNIEKEIIYWTTVAKICRLLVGKGISIALYSHGVVNKTYEFTIETNVGKSIFEETKSWCKKKVEYDYFNQSFLSNIDKDLLTPQTPIDVLELCERMIDVLEEEMRHVEIEEFESDFEKERKRQNVVVIEELEDKEIKRKLSIFLKTNESDSRIDK